MQLIIPIDLHQLQMLLSQDPVHRGKRCNFDAKEVVSILVDLMKGVTAKEKTAATVNAAVGAAAQLTNLLKVHLDAKKLDFDIRRFEASQKGRRGISKNSEEDC